MRLQGRCLVNGTASGELLFSDIGLSIFGGVDPQAGDIIDRHHPLCGKSITDRILAIPSGRGSCTASAVFLEVLLRERAPAGLVFQEVEEIITLGVLVGKILFNRSIPVLVLSPEDFSSLRNEKFAAIISGTELATGTTPLPLPSHTLLPDSTVTSVQLSERDKDILAGNHGAAARVSMEILLKFAEIQGATRLLDISKAHVDACIYTGPAGLRFAQKLLAMGAKFVILTTLNAISIDQRRWRDMGMDPEFATQADELANAYVSMGAMPTFTCAPYMLETIPESGEDIGWSESNAVAFANSVLGARTQKYPDFLDVCIALTGRAPLAGCHLEEGRLPSLLIQLPTLNRADDSLYPLLGYYIGELTGQKIPLIYGLEHLNPTWSDLKAFGAAFATTSPASMFHIKGITPEAQKAEQVKEQLTCINVDYKDLVNCWYELNTARDSSVELVSLGNPHFSLDEFAHLARLSATRKKSPNVAMIVTTSRETYHHACKTGHINTLEAFGATVITDTCWCMIREPVIRHDVQNIMTNSAKYAHYAPGMVKRGIHFGNLAQCVDATCTGAFDAARPPWLE